MYYIMRKFGMLFADMLVYIKVWIEHLLSIFILIYFGAFMFNLLFGIMDARYTDLTKGCYKPLARIEYVFPAYRVGCYLGSTPNSKFKGLVKVTDE